jgi:hypothetical protein
VDKDQIQNRFQTYAVCLFVSLGIIVAMTISPLLSLQSNSKVMWIPPMGVVWYAAIGAIVLMAASAIQWLVIMWTTWRQVQHPGVRWSPALAVLPLLIPIVHFVWSYFCFVGLSDELNARLKRDGITGPRVNRAIALTTCVMPLIMYLISDGLRVASVNVEIAVIIALIAVNFLLNFVMMYQFYRASYAIAEHAEKPIYVPLAEPPPIQA